MIPSETLDKTDPALATSCRRCVVKSRKLVADARHQHAQEAPGNKCECEFCQHLDGTEPPADLLGQMDYFSAALHLLGSVDDRW